MCIFTGYLRVDELNYDDGANSSKQLNEKRNTKHLFFT